MCLFDVVVHLLLEVEELGAVGALVGDVLEQLLVRMHPLEVATKRMLTEKKYLSDYFERFNIFSKLVNMTK